MLGGDEIAKQFVGGDAYQAFLSAFNYHRWHSPISGPITHAEVLPGTYYATNRVLDLIRLDPIYHKDTLLTLLRELFSRLRPMIRI